ncbi:unnamed protein product [Urochloa humidicola]
MSFLQISNNASQSAPEDAEGAMKVTMHDLVYDLATKILDQELVALNDLDEMNRSRLQKNYCRHMQSINYQKQSIDWKEIPSKIRSLHFMDCNRLQLQDKSFFKCKYLRVLDISGCSIKGESVPRNTSLPSSIHHLILLRYLDASGLPITSLQKSLHQLQNMQTLILSNCALETLPDNIGSLLNLCYLDLSGNISLSKLPLSFGELSALWFLNLSACSKLYELPESIDKLICLRHLNMSGCNELQKLPDKFGSLPKLLLLNLSGCSKLVKLPDSVSLKSLEHLNLSSCHELQSLPHDFGNLENLEIVKLSDCYKVQLLPESFSHQLKHLKDLDLSDCHDLKELPECFGSLSELQSLDLTSCSKLQSLPESFGGLSKLNRLSLSYCIRLEYLPSSFCRLKLEALYMKALQLRELPAGIGNMTSLKVFEVYLRNNSGPDVIIPPSILRRLKLHERAVKHTVQEVDYGRHSSIVNIGKLDRHCHQLEISHLARVEHPEDAERAKLRDNPELRELRLSWEHADRTENKRDAEVLENLIPPRTLEGFELAGYRSTSFPNWMLEISSYLPYLTSIKLVGLTCDSLPPLGMLANLRLLLVWGMPNLMKIGKEFYGEGGACRRLRVIALDGLHNLEEWWTTRSSEEEADDEFLVPNLHELLVTDCPKLKFLPYPPKSLYWNLTNSDEVLPPVHDGFGRLSSSTVPFQAKMRSSSFTADKWGRLQHLSSLEKLVVIDRGSSSLPSLPEATTSTCLLFPSLRMLELSLPGLETLPEWLGQLATLEAFAVSSSPNLSSLPESIRNLKALKKLIIWRCPRLAERCKGEDAHKISHIPEVDLD